MAWLLCMASMHGCILQRKDGSLIATLALRGSEGWLEIACTAQMPNQRPQIKVNLCVFSTSVGTDAVIGRLQSSLPSSVDPTMTVEVTGDGKLLYLES
jgi:hypothetical protein